MSIPEVGKKIRVTVPSTTANLGPGFDCLGAALDLYNEFIFTRIEGGGDRFDLIMESTAVSYTHLTLPTTPYV